jgi:hypothetical protein
MLDRSEIVCDTAPFVPSDPRIEKLFRAVERVLPNTGIHHAILSSRHKWEPVSNRVQLVNDRAFDSTSRDHLTTIFGNGKRNDDMVTITLGKSSKGEVGNVRRAWTIRVSISNEREYTLAVLPDLLGAVCESTTAINGWAGSFSSLYQISIHTNNTVQKTHGAARAHGDIASKGPGRIGEFAKRSMIGKMSDGYQFEMPLSWVNYWSDPVAQSLDFPNVERDKCLEGLYREVNNHGWLLKLTDKPLDLRISEHVERFNWAYGRFSKSDPLPPT